MEILFLFGGVIIGILFGFYAATKMFVIAMDEVVSKELKKG